MNNRHRRVAKLKQQELNRMKTNFKNEYGISADEMMDLINSLVDSAKDVANGVGKGLESLGKRLQGK